MKKEQEKKYIEQLIENTERDLVNMRVQENMYQKEYAKPKHISKAKAEESLLIYQKRIKFLEENIEVYQLYIKDHEL